MNWIKDNIGSTPIYGLHEKTKFISDYPIKIKSGYNEIHPVTKATVQVFHGKSFLNSKRILQSARFYLSPHYFYDYEHSSYEMILH